MKKCRNLAAALCASISLTVGGNALADDTLTLRYNQWFPSSHWSQVDGLLDFFRQVETVTDGRVKIQPSAKPLAPPNRNYQAVTSGIADVAWGPHGYTPGAFPLTEMVEFPFDTVDAEKSSIAYWRTFKEHFQPTGMQEDVVTLAMHVTSGGNIHMKDDAVVTPEDLSGKKIRVQTPVVSNALQELGVSPISGSLVELREFLSRGVIDGTALSDEFVTGFKIDKYVNHVTRIPGGLYSNSAFIIMNKDKWDQISPEDQAAIRKISGEVLSARMGKLWDENDLKGREFLKAKLGEEYREASPELMDALAEAFAPQRAEWFNVANENGVDGKAVMDFYRNEIDSLQ
ncbi:TRAP transporter substrate-binding protein [Marinobacterium mangrovicola]|uniref:TRAP-type C4-dicarboxylate transport system substrate-binding protein n=1 Tax=Marinobacterium mangrovicola TaxID=1476959 RepID=A0A4V2PD95_9GAMM|nr:TRAP transporter substrate-binding protein [Marinobacterium mangrovicola]TCK04296.1 TRAP-type C4-dicarboxylate transport system substrate-binding protein [Marinobacterium mangrovicola]